MDEVENRRASCCGRALIGETFSLGLAALAWDSGRRCRPCTTRLASTMRSLIGLSLPAADFLHRRTMMSDSSPLGASRPATGVPPWPSLPSHSGCILVTQNTTDIVYSTRSAQYSEHKSSGHGNSNTRKRAKDRSLKDSPREALSIDRLRRLVLLERLFNRPVVSQRVSIHREQLGMHERRGVENVMLLGLRHRQLVSERGGERYPENLRAPQARQPAQ